MVDATEEHTTVAKITEIEGVGPVTAARLAEADVKTTAGLLKAAADKKGRADLAEATGLSKSQIMEWVNRADLMRVRGVGSEYSDLLEVAGVDTVKELRNRNAENLTAKMETVNADFHSRTGKTIVRRTPSAKEVVRWIEHAAQLPPVVTY